MNVRGVSKLELALFIVTNTKMDQLDKVVEEVMTYRKKQQELPKVDFEDYFLFLRKNIINKVYGVNEDGEKLLIKKTNNLNDYADAVFRYFSHTNLLYSPKSPYLDILPFKEREVQKILFGNNLLV